MGNDHSENTGWRIARRTALKGIGVAGVGIAGFSGSVTARGPDGNGPPGRSGPGGRGPPGQSCGCEESAGEFIAKYDFECVLEGDQIGTAQHDGDDWLTLSASWGDETVFTVNLDEEVYDGWPDNPDAYMMEVIIDASYGECHDEYRFGFHGGDGEEGVGFGGYAKPNFAAPEDEDDRETYHEDDVTGFSAGESEDQQTYTFTVDWDALTFHNEDESRDSPGLSESVDIEVFGGDGGEGIGATSGCIEAVATAEKVECLDWDFVLAEGDDVIDITYEFDEDTFNKEGEKAEPNYIEFDADGYVVQGICAFGGRDTASAEAEAGLDSFSSDLENPGGQEAAIGNVTFCGEAVTDDNEEAEEE